MVLMTLQIMTELDKRRELLKLKSESYLKELEIQSEELKQEGKHWLKLAAITGGAALAAYLLLGRSRKKKYQKSPEGPKDAENYVFVPQEKESTFVRELKTQLTYMLVSLAKEKLYEYLSSLNKRSNRESEDI